MVKSEPFIDSLDTQALDLSGVLQHPHSTHSGMARDHKCSGNASSFDQVSCSNVSESG